MSKLEAGQAVRAMKERREARKEGRRRLSPYEHIAMLKAFHIPWLNGWDAMDDILRSSPDFHTQ